MFLRFLVQAGHVLASISQGRALKGQLHPQLACWCSCYLFSYILLTFSLLSRFDSGFLTKARKKVPYACH